MTSLKILFVIDSLGTGGAERYLAEQLPQLGRFNVTPIVVSLRQRQEGVQADLQRHRFDVRILPASGLIGRVAALRAIIRAERPDVIQTVLFHADLAGRLAAVGFPAKVISRLVNTDYDERRFDAPNIKTVRFRLARLIDGWTARHLTHHVYANSNAVKTAAMRDLKLPSDKITVIEESRDAARLGRPGPQRRKLARSRLGLGEHREVLVNIGRQDYQKGQRYLLEAMARLVSTRPHLVLLIAGRSGDVSGQLDNLCNRLGLKEQVQFLGHREDVPDILAAADLFVFPSLYEGLPGAVIEAMALGVPVVASDIDPVRETVEVGHSAVLVTPASSDELATAIERLLEDPVTAERLGRRGREIFEARFTLEQSMARVLSFYQQAVFLNGRMPLGVERGQTGHCGVMEAGVTDIETSKEAESDPPLMSVILATPDCYETIRKTIRHLRTQTVKHQLEIIIVAPSARVLALNKSELREFCRVRVVEVGKVMSIGSANAKGIRHARAPIVALAEDHAFPAPEWAEALIAAHRHPWAAVGAVIRHPNDPKNVIAWADVLIGFGEYLAPVESGVVERLPGNNSSYKREVLLEYGPDLETLMETESLIHTDLRKKGHRLFLESAAQVSHLNFERMSSFLCIKYLSGRIFGAARARGWSLPYRLLFACGTPLIPFVRHGRLRKQWDALRRTRKLPWGVMPMAWCGLLVSATGEMIGCCLGGGQAVEKRAKFEFHRVPHLARARQTRRVEVPACEDPVRARVKEDASL